LRRRELLPLLGGAVLATRPFLARAQQTGRVSRIGFLAFGNAASVADRVEALRAGLRALDYIEGKNLVIEFRWTETVEQLQEAAADLVRMNVDVIFAISSTETERASEATKSIPIVFGTHADPVELGHVASLSRPGGNVTGLSVQLTELAEKSMEILKETVPDAKRFGVLWTPSAPSGSPTLHSAETAGTKLNIKVEAVSVLTVADFDGAFALMARNGVGAVLVHAASLTARHNPTLLAQVALKHRLPTMFNITSNVPAGGLMAYAPDTLDMMRRSATYIDKILKGAKPADLPVEQASKFQLVINLKTAGALGLKIPSAILARADEVIE
jgi:putative tryptophan/tyrosine transport system substrate-binding protein